MKALKAYFLSLKSRERILVSILVVVAAVIALTLFTQKARSFWRKESANLTKNKTQTLVIASREAVEKRAIDASAKLVPGESLNPSQLTSAVTELARGANIRNPSINPVAETSAVDANIAIHSVRVGLANVPWTNLRDFYVELQKRRPYITIDEMTVNMTDQKTGMHRVDMKLSSIEVKQ